MSTRLLLRTPQDASAWSASLLSRAVGFLIPLIIGAYWPIFSVSQGLAASILRPGVLGLSVLLAIMWSGVRVTWAETHLLKILILVCVVVLIPTLTATIVSRAMTDWIKLVALSLIALLLSRGLRHPATARAFGFSLIVAALFSVGLILFVYQRELGMTMPTYTSVRVLKGLAQRGGVPLNAIAFTAVFAYTCGMCLLPGRRLLWVLGFGIFVVSFALTGSRAPLGIAAGSVVVLLVFNGFLSKHLLLRVLAWFGVALLPIVLVVAFESLTTKQLSEFTEGRWGLWSVAWQKFTDRPLIGYGYESWQDDLISRVPGDYQMTIGLASNFAGGYHSEYLTLLAEQGVAGFLVATSFCLFLLRRSWQLAFRKSASWHNGQWAFFGCLFLLFRAAVESPGLFGYGQDPADFLAFIFVAIVLSRFSAEEEHLRRVREVVRLEEELEYSASLYCDVIVSRGMRLT
jgi:O-antigen ligase